AFPSYRQILSQWFLCVSHRFAYFDQYDVDVLLHLSNLAKYVDEFVSYGFYFVYTSKDRDILYRLLDLIHIDDIPRAWLFGKLKLHWLGKYSNCNIHRRHNHACEKSLFWYADVYKA